VASVRKLMPKLMWTNSGISNANTSGRARWAAGMAVGGWLLCMSATALAQDNDAYANEQTRGAVPMWTGYHLKSVPGWSIGLEPYAGLGVLSAGDGSRGHALAGGISRLRISYFEMGAGLEVSDLALVEWKQIGGFVGVFLPMVNWVDIDAAVGLAQRSYLNGDDRYGLGGLDLKTSTLTFRLGFSDRVIDERFGLTLGASLLFDADLKHKTATWAYQEPNMLPVVGQTQVGGYTTALVATLGFDVAFRRSH